MAKGKKEVKSSGFIPYCCICGGPALYREMPQSEFYLTPNACLKAGLRWVHYCGQHRPPSTIGRWSGEVWDTVGSF